MNNDFKYDILETFGTVGEGDYVTKVRMISWNDREPVLDIRKWKFDDSRMGKGISLPFSEVGSLIDILFYADDFIEEGGHDSPMTKEEMLEELANQNK